MDAPVRRGDGVAHGHEERVEEVELFAPQVHEVAIDSSTEPHGLARQREETRRVVFVGGQVKPCRVERVGNAPAAFNFSGYLPKVW